jgi:plastocyanin
MIELYGKRVWIMTLLLMAAVSIIVLPSFAVPAIKILEPTDGSEIQGDNVTVVVDVSDFELVDKLGQENVEGEGHIHYYMDAAVPTAPGNPAITAPGTYAPIANTSYTWQNVAPGMHNFSVQLVNNDHTPLAPMVLSQNTVEVMGSDNVSAEGVTVDLAVRNIRFNKSTITVPAGAHVTMNFDNQESVPHNFALYDNSQAENVIFKGEVITGPRMIVYTFDAPEEPGTYFFRCDIHPRGMTGQFIVE